MLETNSQRGAPPVKARSACTAMAGPRSEPPNADVHHQPEGLAGAAPDGPVAHAPRKAEHTGASAMTACSIPAPPTPGTGRLPQRHMQHGAIFGSV